jgi:hypothetical protein
MKLNFEPTKYLRIKLKKKSIKKNIKNDMSQLGLTFQTHGLDYKIRMILYKTN